MVLDTNVVLDLLVFADPSTAPLPALLQSGVLRWIATAQMRAELERVLAYPQIAPRLLLCERSAAQVLARFDAGACLVDAAPRCTAVCKDQDDQPFIDLAVAHSALLLSKDKAVLQLRKRLLACGAEVARAWVLPH